MEAVGTLAGGIAHDYNNHLQGISGYIQLLFMMRGDRVRTEQGWLLQIERSVKRAAALTKQLLIFSRKEESRLEPIDLNEVVRQAQKTLARTIPETITAELKLAAELASVDGDAVQLEHVLFNLGINAKDAMPDGGKIVIETRNVLDAGVCRSHAGVTPGAYVELTFADSGHGMDRETMRGFQPLFYTTKGVGSGIGLGLAIVYGIVQSHHGLILCESNLEKGTTLRVYLPVQEREGAAPAKEERKRGDYRGAETIIIVDDEPDIIDIGQNTLEQFGYTVLTARSGEEAVEMSTGGRGIASTWSFSIWGCRGWAGERCLKELLRMNPW